MSAIDAIAHSLTVSLGVPVDSTAQHARAVREAARRALRTSQRDAGWFEVDGQAYFYAAFDDLSADLLVAGPLDPGLMPGADPLSTEMRERIAAAVTSAARGLRRTLEAPQLRMEVTRQMELLSNAIMAVSGELELDVVLRRIVDLARNFAAARYAALGIPGPSGVLETFITAGISQEEVEKIGDYPVGKGILGWLLKQDRPVRINRLSDHPMFEGFPPNHPRMENFLGVPIITRDGTVVGSLYLTEKRFTDHFSVEDEMIVELLARHAAVAIENARLYQALRHHERRLSLLLDQLPEAVVVIEREGERVTIMNQHARELLELDDESPLPEISQLGAQYRYLDENDLPVEFDEIAPMRTLRNGEVVARELVTVVMPDGLRRTLLVNSAPLMTAGEVEAAVCVFQDITEIRDADRIKDDFLSMISHELRTPLTAIHGGSQMLLSGLGKLDVETRRELLTDIHQESDRLASLIQNIVQLAHIRAGRISVECEPVLMRFIVNAAVERFRADGAGREFVVDVEPHAVALADPDRVDEMLTNVIQNAVKYAPGSAPIEISARVREEAVELAVRDHGPGIPLRDLSSVFERFERGSRASSSTPGMGLGLYIVKLLAESQGGSVRLELPEDGGTRVVMTLPAAVADEEF